MDPMVLRIVCAAVAVAFGLVLFLRRRGRNVE
jgi:hypothetical protein